MALICSAILVATLADGCAQTSTPPANAGDSGVRISINTPQGVRAKQVMDMLNSDWPIGPIGIKTLAATDQVDYIGTVMDGMWWERPYTVAGVDIGAGSANAAPGDVLRGPAGHRTAHRRRHLGGQVRRDTPRPRRYMRWADVDAALSKSGARYSYRVSKVDRRPL